MHLANPVAVVVAGPLPGAVFDRRVATPQLADPPVRPPLVGVEQGVGAVVACTSPSSVARSESLTTCRHARPEARPIVAATGGRSLAKVP